MNPELVARYRTRAPRYTSYPSAPHFQPISQESLKQALNNVTGACSLYVHLPFCEHLCLYCGCHVEIRKSREVADPYIEGLLKEFELWLSFTSAAKLEQLCLGGGTPTFLRPDQMETLVLGLKKRLSWGSSIDASIEIDPRTINDTYLKTLIGLGFNRFSFGVQDFDSEVLEQVARPTEEGKVEQCVATLRSELPGCDLNLDLMYGLPHQTPESFKKTLATTTQIRPTRVALFHYAHVPWMKPAQKVLEKRGLPDSDQKATLFTMATEHFLSEGYSVIGMDHFALPGDELLEAQEKGHLQRNFMGYTTRADLDQLGIGVSAIGSFSGVYAQDFKERERWLQELEAGCLPVERGFVLSAEDKVRKSLIMELFCNFRAELPLGWDFSRELEKLAGMEQDGLVVVEGRKIRVTVLGRNFIRNVCAVFDVYLEPEGTTRRYSMTA
jgi:oxygen-independent coproporphyrinogen-3 oxidase